jgi:DNA-binding response OmpR family regulator
MEDHEILARAIGTGLRREGMAVDVVLNGDDALGHLAVTRYDVVVLDRHVPGTHGDEICRRLAAGRAATRILMLTAASTVAARVQGLGLGADNYLPKPFDFAELTARIRALARRHCRPCSNAATSAWTPAAGSRPGPDGGSTSAPKEFAVLECLLASAGRVISAEDLLEQAWDEAADPFTTTVKTTMRRLRAKLGEPPAIRTVREGGYQIGEA